MYSDLESHKHEAKVGTSAMNFISELNAMNPSLIWVGADFWFGAGQAGDVDLLQRFFPVSILGPVTCEAGKVISSRRIRQLVEAGDALRAELLQGWRGLRLVDRQTVGRANACDQPA